MYYLAYIEFISTGGKLKNMPNHNGNKTHNLWNANYPSVMCSKGPVFDSRSPLSLMFLNLNCVNINNVKYHFELNA